MVTWLSLHNSTFNSNNNINTDKNNNWSFIDPLDKWIQLWTGCPPTTRIQGSGSCFPHARYVSVRNSAASFFPGSSLFDFPWSLSTKHLDSGLSGLCYSNKTQEWFSLSPMYSRSVRSYSLSSVWSDSATFDMCFSGVKQRVRGCAPTPPPDESVCCCSMSRSLDYTWRHSFTSTSSFQSGLQCCVPSAGSWTLSLVRTWSLCNPNPNPMDKNSTGKNNHKLVTLCSGHHIIHKHEIWGGGNCVIHITDRLHPLVGCSSGCVLGFFM